MNESILFDGSNLNEIILLILEDGKVDDLNTFEHEDGNVTIAYVRRNKDMGFKVKLGKIVTKTGVDGYVLT